METPAFFLRALREVACEHGDRLLAVASDPAPVPGVDVLADGGLTLPQLARAVSARCSSAPVAAVVATKEVHTISAARLALELGVARNPLSVVEAARDKARMKEIWQANGIATPRSVPVDPQGPPPEASLFPLVVKPTHGYASVGVRRVDNSADLARQLDRIAELNTATLAQGSASFLAEPYLDGREYCVDTVWFDGDPLCDGVLARYEDPNAEHTFPDRLYVSEPWMDPALRASVTELTHRAVRALGLRFGPTHTEVRFHRGQPHVLECAARPGANAVFHHLLRSATGTDFTRAFYLSQICTARAQLDRGPVPTAVAEHLHDGAHYFWYQLPYQGHGTIREIRGLEALDERPDVELSLCYKQPGDVLYPHSDMDPQYFCSVVARYQPGPGSPPLWDHVRSFDQAVEVLF
ncbi:ATP-grasp domain-containing protein [Streptomyces tsukubensis]|uniref:ATP-grasp domain-containing protein n=1 Tax=Streptomyces tsukubensis TaxID=83656 RepID=UPI00344DC673